MSDVRAREMGAFLRSRRDRLTPADVGLPPGGRRRVAGLRREEVAVLASVGTTWYTWLEQGRDVRPSLEVLTSLADALMLDPDERRHLLVLGGHAAAVETPECTAVGKRLRAVLDAFMPNPAVVQSPRFDAIAYNRTWRFLHDDIEARPAADRNCAYLHLTDPGWADVRDNEGAQAAIVAKLRAYYADSLDDPSWQPFLQRLRDESPAFRRLWDRADVALETDRVRTVRSSRVGLVRLTSMTMLPAENVRTRVTVLFPADDASAAKLTRLAEMVRADAPALRAVPS